MLCADVLYGTPFGEELFTGTPEEQEQARRRFRRERQIRDILAVIKREIPRADLIFGRWVEVESTGELFHPWAGDVGFSPEGVVYYMDEQASHSCSSRPIPPTAPNSNAGNRRRSSAAPTGQLPQKPTTRPAARPDVDAHIQFVPLATLERLNSLEWNRAGRTLYDPSSLSFLPSKTEVPLLIDHDTNRQIGVVNCSTG
jgi:hypothetical protein